MAFKTEPPYSHGQAARTGVLWCNLGTPEAATAQWRFVSSVVEPAYQASAGEPLVTQRNTRKLA